MAERLEAEGLRVGFDRAEIDPGTDLLAQIERGLERSPVLLLCMSAAVFASEWVRIERDTLCVFFDL